MSADVTAGEGVKLVADGKYTEGIQKLTQALKDRPAPRWLIERSKAYTRTKEFDLALHDAEEALAVAFKRANRDFMTEAQIRRAITLFRMGRYADADVVAYWAIRLIDGAKASEVDGQDKKVDENGDYTQTLADVNTEVKAAADLKKSKGLSAAMQSDRSKDQNLRNEASTWRMQALTRMEQLPAGAPGRKVSVAKYPISSEAPSAKKTEDTQEDKKNKIPKVEVPNEVKPGYVGGNVGTDDNKGRVEKLWKETWSQFQTMHSKNKVRLDFYQSDTAMTVSLFVKNVSKDELKVDAREQSITLSPIPSVPSGKISLRLFNKIKPADTSYTVKAMKIELVLHKEIPGKWPVVGEQGGGIPIADLSSFVKHAQELGFNDPEDLTVEKFGGNTQVWYDELAKKLQDKADDGSSQQIQPAASQVNAATAPRAAEAAPSYPTSSKKGSTNWDQIDVEEDEKDKDVNDFFKQIYNSGNDEMKRAMMKSFTESNGTALSTNWAEASSKTYETQPPDGAEVKDY